MIRYLQKLKHKKGFTLVEMTVVMCIIAVLSSMMVPQLSNLVKLARVSSVNVSAATIRKNISAFMITMTMEGTGMKRGGGTYNKKYTSTTSQIIWLVNDGNWLVKTECKPCMWDGTKWTVIGNQNDAISQVYNDPKNWYTYNGDTPVSKFQYCADSVTSSNPNHLLALTSVVRDCVSELKKGIVLALFDGGICKGIIYIPDWDYLWPESDYSDVSEYIKGMAGKTKNNGTVDYTYKRPWIYRYSKDAEGKRYLPEFNPWHGKWPRDVDDEIWKDGVAGICAKYELYVGTSPAIIATAGKRAYSEDWEDPIPGTKTGDTI